MRNAQRNAAASSKRSWCCGGRPSDKIHTRIVWGGGAITELGIQISVHAATQIPSLAELEARVLELESSGNTDAEIARILTE